MLRLEEYCGEVMKTLQMGVFLVAGNNPPNIMPIHWGFLGMLWNKPVFAVPVRYSRYTNDLIEQYHEFAVSVPRKDMSTEIYRIGGNSGRDVNKFEKFHLHPGKTRKINSYIVADCGLHLECKVIFKTGMETFQIFEESVKDNFYPDKNYHTMFYGEIVDAYEK